MRLRTSAVAVAVSTASMYDELARRRRMPRPVPPIETSTVEPSPLHDALVQYLENLP